MKRWAVILTVVSVVGCGGSGRSVERVKAGEGQELSGNWSDIDAKETSDTLIADCFKASWLEEFSKEQGRKPAVRVRGVVNKTDEHIDAQVFIKSMEKAMVNSGKVKVLAQEGSELGSVEAEQERGASGKVSDESAPSIGNETGADFVVAVRVASILDQVQGKRAKFYKINFELISPSSGEKVWIGDHEIKKLVSQAKARW